MTQTIITRTEAKAQGLKTYFTAKACKNGHVSTRKTSNGECSECARAVCRRHYENNTEYHHAKTARYREENREKYNEYNRDYYNSLSPEKRAARQTPYNPEYFARYYKANKDKYFASAAARRARLMGDLTVLTAAEKVEVRNIYKTCRLLNRKAGVIAYHVDHIIPLAKGGRHHPDNLRIITAEENLKKGAKLIA